MVLQAMPRGVLTSISRSRAANRCGPRVANRRDGSAEHLHAEFPEHTARSSSRPQFSGLPADAEQHAVDPLALQDVGDTSGVTGVR